MSNSKFYVVNNSSEAEARSLRGKMDSEFREMYSTDIDVNQVVMDFYERNVNRIKRGSPFPVAELPNWKSVEQFFEIFVLHRIAPNFTQMMKSSHDGVKMSMIPLPCIAPHPTDADHSAYMSRWKDDGDLYKIVMEQCRKCNQHDKIIFIPQIVHSMHPKSLLMLTLTIIIDPK